VFLPCRRTTTRHARKLETILAPFFPGYLFVSLDLGRDRWRSVNGTFGVARLVMHGEVPAPVPKGIIEAFLDACDDGEVLHLSPTLRVGQSVRILEGPFTEFIGELDRLDDAGRVRVLMDIMGGRVTVILPRESVVPANSSL
jgi:transcriptional antiterminator RfaH